MNWNKENVTPAERLTNRYPKMICLANIALWGGGDFERETVFGFILIYSMP